MINNNIKTPKIAMKLINIIFISAILISSAMAHTFSGLVTDKSSREPLPGANIVVVGEGKGASADLDGNFFIPNIEEGTFKIVVSMVGYHSDTLNVRIPKDLYKKVRLASHVQTEQPVIITANRSKQNLQESPVTVTVIDNEKIDQVGALKMDEAIRTAPGVTMNRESISLRNCSGFSYGVGSRVLLMVDGVPMLAGDTGEIKWDALPVGQIKQIEIVKNSGSALYGSNAMGGIINIITQDAEPGSHLNIDIDFGVYDKPYYDEWDWSDKTRTFNSIGIKQTNNIGNWSTLLNFNHKMSDSYKQLGDYKGFSGLVKAKYAKDGTSDLTLSANIAYEDRANFLDWLNVEHALEVDSMSLNDRVWSSKAAFTAAYNKRNFEKKRFLTARLYTNLNHFDDKAYDPQFQDSLQRRNSTSSNTGTDIQLNYNAFDNHDLTLGGEAKVATTKSNLFGQRIGAGGAVFVQDEYAKLNPLVLSAGLRTDFFVVPHTEDYNNDGTNEVDTLLSYFQVNPKVGAVYHLAENIALRSSFGTGYRVPSMGELFTELKVSGLVNVHPNPELEAEKSISTEIGGNIITPFSIIDVAVFSNWYQDLIEPQVIPGSTNDAQFQNITNARISGAEISMNVTSRLGDIGANYLYTDSRDENNEKLPYRPDHSFSVNGKLKYYKNFAITADYRYKSARDFELYPTAPSVPEKVLDLGHTINWNKYYFNVRVNNVLQYNYSEVEKGLSPIRNYVFSLGMRI